MYDGPRTVSKMRHLLIVPLSILFSLSLETGRAEAKFFSRLSFSLLEGYSENVRFSEDAEADFVSRVVPSLIVMYKPSWQATPNFIAHLSVAGEYFARRTELNNFGDHVAFSSTYAYPYSQRLNFFSHASLISLVTFEN